MVHELTKNTTDPKYIGYVRLGIKDIYEAILLNKKVLKPNE